MKNGILLQAFEWQLPSDGDYYNKLKNRVESLSQLGFTGIWLPPAAKGESVDDVGYGNYDYWDLGEFDQKGTVRTKYGTKAELVDLIHAFHEKQIQVYADMVFNHKNGADFDEVFTAIEVNPENRTEDISEAHEIKSWTGFDFEGRHNQYSDFKWRFEHFTGVDYDANTDKKGIFRIVGDNKYWHEDTDNEKGNFDYLMGANIDHTHPDVKEELKRVSDYMIDEMGYDGFRYDALKHISNRFIDELTHYILGKKSDFYFVGEYWKNDENAMKYYLDQTDYQIDLFDVALHFNLHNASVDEQYDLRTIFEGTLVKAYPDQAVTFVDNHDSQPGQALESWVEPWFKEIAYALILLRQDGYPCVFLGDYDGIYHHEFDGIKVELDRLINIRHQLAWGNQEDYFVSEKCIGFVRHGDEEHPEKMAVVISSGDMNQIQMNMGESYAGKTFVDLCERNDPIQLDDKGQGFFTVPPASITIWKCKEI